MYVFLFSAADTEHFLIDLFSMDPLVRSSGEKFSAWYVTVAPAAAVGQ